MAEAALSVEWRAEQRERERKKGGARQRETKETQADPRSLSFFSLSSLSSCSRLPPPLAVHVLSAQRQPRYRQQPHEEERSSLLFGAIASCASAARVCLLCVMEEGLLSFV